MITHGLKLVPVCCCEAPENRRETATINKVAFFFALSLQERKMTINFIPLNKLTSSAVNVRRINATAGLAELEASILKHGLLQNLNVREAGQKYEVIAGARRFAALKALAKKGAIARDFQVPVNIGTKNDIAAAEISLAENVQRINMHDADTDNHAAQESVYFETPDWQREPHQLKRLLTKNLVSPDDALAIFVGDTYQKSGGKYQIDLFSENGGYLVDSDLLNRLAMEKLASFAEQIKAEGWQWVETSLSINYEILQNYRRNYPKIIKLSEEQEEEYSALKREQEELSEIEHLTPEGAARLEEIERLVLPFEKEVYAKEIYQYGGALIGVSYAGDFQIERGLVRNSDIAAYELAGGIEKQGGGEKTKAEEGGSDLSAALALDLARYKTQALACEIAARPDKALVLLVYHLAAQKIYNMPTYEGVMKLSAERINLVADVADPDNDRAGQVLQEQMEKWKLELPTSRADLWSWCLASDQKTLLRLLAFLVGISIDCSRHNHSHADASNRLADDAADAVDLDMRNWWQPSALFFKRVPKSFVATALTEAGAVKEAAQIENMKKTDIIEIAIKTLGSGWLPQPLKK